MAGESKGPSMAGILAEIAAITAIFAAVGSWPVPDVNETVYLTKARHFADPSWGRGDFFLETPDAHGVFYLLFSPLAASLSLEQAAWIGRVAGWLMLAAGFRHAVVPLVAAPWGRLAAAATFALVMEQTTMAGEWVIGGCEAKVFAWALVFGALGEIGFGRFGTGWLLLGAATAVHPIVGGWAMVVLLAMRLFPGFPRGSHRPLATAALLGGGVALAAAGVLPALSLTAGIDGIERAAATRIYVVDRLHHHLLPRAFPGAMVARHVLAFVVWWLLHRLAPGTAARSRLTAFTLAAVAISLLGFAISLAEPFAAAATLGVLRYYWFRLADVFVPFALATAAVAVLEDDEACGKLVSARPALVRAAAAILLVAGLAAHGRHWPLPGRSGVPPRADSKVDPAAWADICDWVQKNTPADARFLTPRGSASFTWRTGRREVVAWKNSPQDARSLLAWRRRFIDCFSHGGADGYHGDGMPADMEQSTAVLGAERMRNVAERYDADYAIVPLDEAGGDALPWKALHANAVYAVYRIDAATPTEAPSR
jgi:hypothetical protein